MFEGANSASQGFLWRRAVDAQDEASQANANALFLAKAFAQKRDRVTELEAEVADLRQALAVSEARYEAGKAIISAFKETHPQSPMMANVSKFKDGAPMSKIGQIFIRVFDETARKLGVKNWEAYRNA